MNNAPIKLASISLNDGSGHISKSNRLGGFWRLMTPGQHAILVEATGYLPVTKLIKVEPNVPTSTVHITMTKDSTIAGIPRMVFIMVLGKKDRINIEHYFYDIDFLRFFIAIGYGVSVLLHHGEVSKSATQRLQFQAVGTKHGNLQ